MLAAALAGAADFSVDSPDLLHADKKILDAKITVERTIFLIVAIRYSSIFK
ncbi:MAG: hypothetical protein K2X63_03515 [Burkholderiaceae bacterium]|nr:hypothetical protein [Burkholderiaceae bacterium]